MSLRLKLPLHGRSHKHNGSDPIGNFIEYDVVNVGDWLYIKTTGSGGPIGRSMAFQLGPDGGRDLEINATDGIVSADILFNPYQFDVTAQSINFSTGDGSFEVDPGRDAVFNMLATHTFSIASSTGSTFVVDNDHDITSSPAQDFVVQLLAGQTFTLLDSSSNPKIQWTEGTNDLHIPTGGTIVADL